jgi:hypothetical protein
MKRILGTNQVAHFWANKVQDEGRVAHGNFYFDGDTIYSYGRHFPIAVHYNGIVLFTTRTYSNTTSGHISLVKSAVSHLDIIYCMNPDEAARNYHANNVASFIFNIVSIAKNKLTTARKPAIYMAQIDAQKELLNKYTAFFNIEISAKQQAEISFSNAGEFKEAMDKANKAAEAEKIAQAKAFDKKMKAGKKVFQSFIDSWKSGQSKTEFSESIKGAMKTNFEFYYNQVRYENTTYLRLSGNVVNTFKGVDIPTDVAKRYYAFYNRIVAAGGCDGDCNFKMLEYNVNKATKDVLEVGCHHIPVSEIEYIAGLLGWNKKG